MVRECLKIRKDCKEIKNNIKRIKIHSHSKKLHDDVEDNLEKSNERKLTIKQKMTYYF